MPKITIMRWVMGKSLPLKPTKQNKKAGQAYLLLDSLKDGDVFEILRELCEDLFDLPTVLLQLGYNQSRQI